MPNRRAGMTLLVAILGSSMAFLDGTVVNVALPTMQRQLAIRVDLVQWIVEAYALMLASLVLVGGALGDRWGRKRVYLAGVMLFAIASGACGLAPTPVFLVIARAVQGVGAALLVPGSLSLISAAYDEDERGRAIGTWSAASAITAAVGPVAGGWVVTHGSWRWLFFFNVPIALVIVWVARSSVEESRDEEAARSDASMDWRGATLATMGLGVLTYALIDSVDAQGARRMIPLSALGLITLIAFALVEAKQRAPMVPLALFRSRNFAGTNLLTLLLYAALGGALFFVPFDLVQVHHYTPAAAGASLLPLVLIIAAMSRWAGGLTRIFNARVPLVIGPLVAAAGFALLSLPGTGGSYLRTFFPGVAVLGIGMGITVAPLTATVMGSVDAHHSGVASGINNAVARAAGLLAIAAFGVVLRSRFDRWLDDRVASLAPPPDVLSIVDAQRGRLAGGDLAAVPDEALRATLRHTFDEAFVSGFRTVMIVSAAMAVASALMALWLVDRPPEPAKPQ